MFCSNIAKVIGRRIQDLFTNNKLYLDSNCNDNIFITLFGDKKAGLIKLGFVIGNVDRPNSVANLSIVALFKGKDKPDVLAKAFKPVAEQLNILNNIDLIDTNQSIITKKNQVLLYRRFTVFN